MPGLKAPSLKRVYVRAPEQARFALSTPPLMCTSADLERWQPGVDSAPGTSLYAVGPSASVLAEDWFVLPAQRPASPEIALSPSATTSGASRVASTPGLMIRTCACATDGIIAAASTPATSIARI